MLNKQNLEVLEFEGNTKIVFKHGIWSSVVRIYSCKVRWSLLEESETWTNSKWFVGFGCEYGRHHRWEECLDWYEDEKTCLWANEKNDLIGKH